MVFILSGLASTIWFLIRVIPKPSRAAYPCMRVAAPFMSGFVLWLISVGGLTFFFRRTGKYLHVKIYSSLYLIFSVLFAAAINPSSSSLTGKEAAILKQGPDDGPNQPMGVPKGIKPGRVVWVWDKDATNEDCKTYYFLPENNNQEVIGRMFSRSVRKLTGEKTVKASWDRIFRYFNKTKTGTERGYKKGEKIFIKINQTSGRGKLRESERTKGNFAYPEPHRHKKGEDPEMDLGVCETSPYLVLQILRHLINECGINQSDIAVGDPQNPTYEHNYKAWHSEFPDVIFTDRTGNYFGRTKINPTKNDLIFYSDKLQSDKLYDIIENASYLINVANLKPHSGTGITLTAKNHFGSQSRAGAYHLHYSHICQIEGKPPTNPGYHKYRVLVDLMGSRYLGRNTLIYVVDGLYAGGASEGGPPVKYFMAPFSGDWASSIFISLDQVALESVCYDFLRTEWNGTYRHDPSNNYFEAQPSINGVDDYLHQAADRSNWPAGFTYDPDNSRNPMPSLGVHEHWNNAVNKQYSGNLGRGYGIELVSVPPEITGKNAPAFSAQPESNGMMAGTSLNTGKEKADKALSTVSVSSYKSGPPLDSVVIRSFEKEFPGKMFFAGSIDDDNGKWFLTDAGIVSADIFDVLQRIDLKVTGNGMLPGSSAGHPLKSSDMKDFTWELSGEGQKLWIAASGGIVESIVNNETGIRDARFMGASDPGFSGPTVVSVAAARGMRWFGTADGVYLLAGQKWLPVSYKELYPDGFFREYPIMDMAVSRKGDSVYVATEGAGVARFFRDEADAVSGASVYQQWGPILMPSDSVYCVSLDSRGARWFGTGGGAARHSGNNMMENWMVLTRKDGLAADRVRAVACDPYGRHVWFGTQSGISVWDGTAVTTWTTAQGLISDNILSITVDKNGLVFFGTDKGLMIYSDGIMVCYR